VDSEHQRYLRGRAVLWVLFAMTWLADTLLNCAHFVVDRVSELTTLHPSAVAFGLMMCSWIMWFLCIATVLHVALEQN
jgi:hypothetical protein